MDAADLAAKAERREREATAVRERAARDRRVRQLAVEVKERLVVARRTAEDAATDFEDACAQLAVGATTLVQVESLQFERDAARRAAEIWERAAGSVRADPALAGRR